MLTETSDVTAVGPQITKEAPRQVGGGTEIVEGTFSFDPVQYIVHLLNQEAPDSTKFGDYIPNSRYHRCFCGSCGEPIRTALDLRTLKAKDAMFKYLQREEDRRAAAQRNNKKFRRREPSQEILIALLHTQNIWCEKCEAPVRRWRRAGKHFSRIKDDVTGRTVDQDLCEPGVLGT